jgi:hypothetical protein
VAKLDWLDPKWHGSREEMVAFGRSCRETRNWRMGITLLAADAHYRVMQHLPTEAAKAEYMRIPTVWDDIHTVYTEYLKHYALDYRARSEYAVYCYWCGQYALSHRQFLVVGENLRWSEAFPEAMMKRIRAYAAQAAQPPAGKSPE